VPEAFLACSISSSFTEHVRQEDHMNTIPFHASRSAHRHRAPQARKIALPEMRQIQIYVDASVQRLTGAAAFAVGALTPTGFKLLCVEALPRGTTILEAESAAISRAVKLIPTGMRGLIFSDCEDAILSVRQDLDRSTVIFSGLHAFEVQLVWLERNAHPYSRSVHEAALAEVRALSERYALQLAPCVSPNLIQVSVAFVRLEVDDFPREFLCGVVERSTPTSEPSSWEMVQQVMIQPVDGDVLGALSSLLGRADALAALLSGSLGLFLDQSVPDLAPPGDDAAAAIVSAADRTSLPESTRNLMAVATQRLIETAFKPLAESLTPAISPVPPVRPG